MDYWENFDAKIRECLTALEERIAEFKAVRQVEMAQQLQKDCDEIRGKMNGKY
jgi:hypothetical protein